MRPVPQGQYLGLTFPDPAMTFNEKTGHWEHGEIDWSEFKRVVAGDGPCNRQRIQQRRDADENGAWVREAAFVYAGKCRARAQAAARIAAE
jgi:ring-1,2-phenylacetyl-CoA epoxidase subunit PaaA